MPKSRLPKKPAVKAVAKKVVAKKTTPTRVAKSAKKMSAWDSYCAERDAFYRKHPNSQLLMGILILVILLYLGLYFWSQATAYGWHV